MSAPRTLAWVLAVLALSAQDAQAHDNAPGVLSLEGSDGRYHIAFTRPIDTREGSAEDVEPRYPAHCRVEGEWLACGERGLEGTLSFDGLAGTRMRVLVVLIEEDRAPREFVVSGERAAIELSAPPASVWDWMWVGAEHFWTGLDHLGFLLGLLLVCPRDRTLLFTITAFTVAHSASLALALLDVIRLPSAPVEACIALSVLLVAREALDPLRSAEAAHTLTRRAPWVLAAVFGLVHGLGFAGALQSAALPSGSLATVLLGFNVGLELGQLVVVALVLGAGWIAHRLSRNELPRLRAPIAYVLGAVSAFWLIERVLAF